MTAIRCASCFGTLEEHDEGCPETVMALDIPERDDRDVIALRPAPNSPEARTVEVSASVVAVLRRILARAEAGGIQGVALAFVTDEGGCEALWTDYGDNVAMFASVKLLGAKFDVHMLNDIATLVAAP